MKKRVLALLFVILMISSVFSGCRSVDRSSNNGGNTNNRVTYETANVNVRKMADNIDTWIIDISKYESNPATIFNYCITDLDQNGRVEMLTTVNYSDVTEIKCYEIDEDMIGLKVVEVETASGSNADVNNQYDGTCYKDPATGRIYYIYTDEQSIKEESTGVVNKSTSVVALSLFEGKLYQELLAKKSWQKISGEGETEAVYTDSEGNSITSEEFDNIAQTKFESCDKHTAVMSWKGCTASNHSRTINLKGSDLIILLSDSYEKFSIN